jgi:crotonobetainyl-CoA:carnitine CoA-transferase CaiB-like acyl-CoA transferase
MMAIFHRMKTGEVQQVEAALLPTALMMTNGLLIEQAIKQTNKGRVGNKGTAVAPCDLFRLKDGWILVQIAGQPMFKRWCRMIDKEAWFEDDRFANDDLRAENGDVLNDAMQDWCDQRTVEEAMTALNEARLPGSPLYSPQQALDDPHVQAMGYLKPVDYPGLARPAPVIETPFRLSKTPARFRARPPILGEHTDDILAELGYSDAEVSAFAEKAII